MGGNSTINIAINILQDISPGHKPSLPVLNTAPISLAYTMTENKIFWFTFFRVCIPEWSGQVGKWIEVKHYQGLLQAAWTIKQFYFILFHFVTVLLWKKQVYIFEFTLGWYSFHFKHWNAQVFNLLSD